MAAGSATITVTTEDGSFTDTCAVTVNAATVDISEATITAIADQTYTGSEITPEPVVTLGTTTLVKDTDYTVAYAENTNVGTATLTITGTGAYTGTKSATFQIVKATPAVDTWPTASAITLGQALSASTLSGGSGSVPGTFAFTDPSIIPGSTGTYSAGVTFTATDTANYNTVTGSVDVTVNTAVLNTVYLNGAAGSDTNDGTSAAQAVKTFSRAKGLLATDGGTIYINGLVTITDTQTWDLSGYTNALVIRDSTYTGHLVQMSTGGSLTLSNITIDGNKTSVASANSLIRVNVGSNLIMNSGAILQNNNGAANPGAVFVAGSLAGGGTFTMNDGRITNNSTTSTDTTHTGGGVGVPYGAFYMNGGSIDHNTSPTGGGITARMPIYLNGGIITANTGTNSGNAINATSAGGPYIGADVTIDGSIYCNGSNVTLKVTAPVKSTLLVVWFNTPDEGKTLAVGTGYTLTAADLAKFSSGNSGSYLALNTGTNVIYWTKTASPVAVTGVSLDKDTDTLTVGGTESADCHRGPG